MAILNVNSQAQYLVAPNEAVYDFTTAMSVSLWFRHVGLWKSTWEAFLAKGDGAWRVTRYSGGGDRGIHWATTGTVPAALNWDSVADDDAWHHLVCTFLSGAPGRKYIILDGAIVAADTNVTQTIANTADPLWVGNNSGATTRYLDGYLEDVRVYNRELSLAEAQVIFRGKGSDAIRHGIVSRWVGHDDRPAWGVIDRVTDYAGSNHLWPQGSPPLLAQLLFREGTGLTTANTGGPTRASFPLAAISATVPAWSTNVPPNRSKFSLDFGSVVGVYGIDLPTSGGPITQLRSLTSFTISGWINNRVATEGGGGNRIVTWSLIDGSADGVDLVYKADGSLQVGIDAYPDGSPARSSAGKITTDAGAGAANWRFFALTYDETLASAHTKWYFGTPSADATFDVGNNYDQGPTGTNISAYMTVGNFVPAIRSTGGRYDRMLRGLVNDIKVYGVTSGSSGALGLSDIVKLQWGNPVFLPTYQESFAGARRRRSR